MIKYIIVFALFIATIPFWLPTSLGGDTSYHFVLTDSMKGTLDPGAFVVLRRADSYQVGDAVGYKFDTGTGEQVTILHRIIDMLPDGGYLLKGDAVVSTEEVQPEAVTGRMVFALPALGFLPGAFRQAPLLLGGMLLTMFFVAGGLKQARSENSKSKNEEDSVQKKTKENLFIPATLVILITIPFASVAMVEMVPIATGPFLGGLLEKLPLFAFLLAVVAVTRVGEVIWVNNGPKASAATSVVEINYIIAMVLAVTVIPLPEVLDSARAVLTL